MKGHKVRQ